VTKDFTACSSQGENLLLFSSWILSSLCRGNTWLEIIDNEEPN
jgi:hypothetical protein